MAEKKDMADAPVETVEKPAAKPSKQKPSVQTVPKPELYPVEHLVADNKVAAWEGVAMMRAMGWFPGKMVTEEIFTDALTRFRNRPQGSGKI